jgi:hypothetical protein
MSKWDHAYEYEVRGLPEGEEAWIAEFNHRWQFLRRSKGAQGNWTGEYGSPQQKDGYEQPPA